MATVIDRKRSYIDVDDDDSIVDVQCSEWEFFLLPAEIQVMIVRKMSLITVLQFAVVCRYLMQLCMGTQVLSHHVVTTHRARRELGFGAMTFRFLRLIRDRG